MMRITSAVRRVRRFSSAPNAAAREPRQEYPTSFISHLKTQKMNVFNIGIAFLTLSLSSQLVTAKQKREKAEAENVLLTERVQMLEELVVSLGGTVPAAAAAAAAAAAEAAKADAERIKKAREEEARALTAVANATSEGEDGKTKKKGVLI